MSISADDPRAAFEQASAHFRAGRLREAEAGLRRLLASQPGAAAALELLGVVLGAQGRHAEALGMLDRAIEANPSAATIRHNRAKTLVALGRHGEARSEAERAVELRGDFAPSWILLGNIVDAAGDVAGAERAYRRAAQSPLPEAHYNLGFLLHRTGRTEEAIACYRRAIELQPAFAPAHNNLGNLLRSAGRSDEALVHYRAAVRADPRLAGGAMNLGTMLRERGRQAEAVPWLERAAALDPGSREALNNLGIANYEIGRYEEAVRCYRRALELDPAFREARNNLGNALRAVGEDEEAIACFRRVIEEDPASASAHSNLGMALKERGDAEGALACYRRALELKPDYVGAFINMGHLLQDEGRAGEAIDWYERALAIDPRSATAANDLGLLLLKRHDFARGWELLESRFDMAPPVTFRRGVPIPELTASDLATPQRIAVWGEQGIGDRLLFSTVLPDLAGRGHALVLETEPRLVAAFRRAHPEWTVVGQDMKASVQAPQPAFDGCTRHIAVGSLPRMLRTSLASFRAQPRAILAADPARIAAYRERLAAPGARTVAISWRSFQPKRRGALQRKKSAPLAAFLELSRREDLRLLDVQYGDTASEREAFAGAGGRLARLEDLDLYGDIEGVLAAVAACDAVLTTSNVTAHFAGALGKETLLVYLDADAPFHYWVPGEDGRSPWYPSVRVVTGPDVDTWERALGRAGEILGG